jgi:hypothetical protein
VNKLSVPNLLSGQQSSLTNYHTSHQLTIDMNVAMLLTLLLAIFSAKVMLTKEPFAVFAVFERQLI